MKTYYSISDIDWLDQNDDTTLNEDQLQLPPLPTFRDGDIHKKETMNSSKKPKSIQLNRQISKSLIKSGQVHIRNIVPKYIIII